MTVLKWILVPGVLLALFASKTLGVGLIVEPSGVVLFDVHLGQQITLNSLS